MRFESSEQRKSIPLDNSNNELLISDNLEYEAHPGWFKHPDIPRYFQSYEGAYFIQNPAHCLQYPEDKEALKHYVQIFYKDISIQRLE